MPWRPTTRILLNQRLPRNLPPIQRVHESRRVIVSRRRVNNKLLTRKPRQNAVRRRSPSTLKQPTRPPHRGTTTSETREITYKPARRDRSLTEHADLHRRRPPSNLTTSRRQISAHRDRLIRRPPILHITSRLRRISRHRNVTLLLRNPPQQLSDNLIRRHTITVDRHVFLAIANSDQKIVQDVTRRHVHAVDRDRLIRRQNLIPQRPQNIFSRHRVAIHDHGLLRVRNRPQQRLKGHVSRVRVNADLAVRRGRQLFRQIDTNVISGALPGLDQRLPLRGGPVHERL